MPAWTFELQNRELRFVVRYFADSDKAAVKINWLPEIKRDAAVTPGTALAKLTWSDNTEEELKAPTGCNGKIAVTNRRIIYVDLDKYPSQWALRLA